jgi:hypothetical protein
MVGRHQDVQSRILSENIKAFFFCLVFGAQFKFASWRHGFISAHGDVVFLAQFNVFTQFLQHLPERWKILTTHVADFTLKPLSETTLECRLRSVKPIRFQLG